MSLSRFAALAAGIVLSAGAANAASNISRANISDTFDLGIEGEDYQYREPDFAHLTGGGLGLNATYTLNIDKTFFKANVIADFFDLDYGSEGTGSKNGQTDYLQDYRLMGGYNFKISKGSVFSPYIGFGYRILFDAGKAATSTGAQGYDRRSEYLYIPIGLTYAFQGGGWGFAPSIEYDYFIEGYQTSYFRDLGYDNNIVNHQKNGYGVRAEFMFTPPTDFYHFSFGPYARYWNISDSVAQNLYYGGVYAGYGIEPADNTVEVGLRAVFRFQ